MDGKIRIFDFPFTDSYKLSLALTRSKTYILSNFCFPMIPDKMANCFERSGSDDFPFADLYALSLAFTHSKTYILSDFSFPLISNKYQKGTK